mgnify:CR=1 FL=1
MFSYIFVLLFFLLKVRSPSWLWERTLTPRGTESLSENIFFPESKSFNGWIWVQTPGNPKYAETIITKIHKIKCKNPPKELAINPKWRVLVQEGTGNLYYGGHPICHNGWDILGNKKCWQMTLLRMFNIFMAPLFWNVEPVELHRNA